MKPEDIHWLDDEELEQPETEAEEIPDEEALGTDIFAEDLPEAMSESDDTEDEAEVESAATSSGIGKTGRIVLIVLAILLIGAAALYLTGAYKRIFGGDTAKTLVQTGEPLEYASDSMTHVGTIGNLALTSGSDGIRAYNTKGELLWSEPFTYGYPALSTAGDYAIVADLSGSELSLYNTDGLVRTITTEYPLLYATVNKAGYAAGILDSGDSHTLVIYDPEGNVLVRRITYGDQDGIPVDIAINDDATCMATAYVVYTETTLRSVVTLFNLTDAASDSIDRIAGNYTYTDTLVTDLRYLGDELIFIGDNKIGGIRASGNTAEDWTESLSYEIRYLGFGSDYVALVLGDGLIGVAGDPDANTLILNASGEHVSEQKLAAVRSLSCTDTAAVFQDGFDYLAISPSGEELWTYHTENGMLFSQISSRLVLGNTGSELYFMEIQSVSDSVQ